jgi:hypothetical protein
MKRRLQIDERQMTVRFVAGIDPPTEVPRK